MLLHSACVRRDFISFYATSFYSAACYVFAYAWGRGQPVVLSDLPIVSKYSRTLFLHTHAAGRAIHSTSLSRPVAFTVVGLSPLPPHTNLLRFGRLSHRHGQDACPMPKRHRCRHQPAGSYPSLADIPCASLDYCSNIWFTLSVCPSVYGWKAVDILTWTSSSSITHSQNLDWNRLSLSETTELGNPCKHHISRRKMFAISFIGVSVESGMK